MGAGNQQERLSVEEAKRWFLAGFIEGEGSLCVSIKSHPGSRFGLYVDPEFFLYQHESGRSVLELAREVFGTGRIFPKPGNEHVLVYAIASRRSLVEKVIPFFETYMTFSYKRPIFERFRTIVYAQESKEHFTREGLVRIVRMAYEMNPASKGKERLRTLDEVTERILRDHTPDTLEDFEVKIWSSPLSD
jgi:hypothetical protein